MTKNTISSSADDGDSRVDGRTVAVKALVRGLHVLTAMNDLAPVSVTALVNETGYPKATVIRLLQTLRQEGYVEEADGGRGYQVAAKVLSLSRALAGEGRYQQAASQPLKDLGAALKWPTEMLVRDAHSMVIEASNRDTAPIKLNIFERRRFPMLDSASGIAYLSALPPDEARALVPAVISAIGDATHDGEAAMIARVQAAAARGYALQTYDVLSPNMRVVAIPLFAFGAPAGALSLVHYSLYLPDNVLRQTILPALRTTADTIGKNLQAL